MDPVLKRSKKEARKAGGGGQPADELKEEIIPQVNIILPRGTKKSLWATNPKSRQGFPPVEDELSVASDDLPAHGDGSADISPHINNLPVYLAEVRMWRGGDAAKIFLERERRVAPCDEDQLANSVGDKRLCYVKGGCQG